MSYKLAQMCMLLPLAYLVMPMAVKCDAPDDWQLLFQDPASPVAAGVFNLHHDIIIIIFFLSGFVFWMLFRTVYLFSHTRNLNPSKVVHGTTIEIIWTITPSIILMVVAIPSFALLYSLEEVVDPAITLKVIGHQWYWSYEYSDYVNVDGESIDFDSYMVPTDELEPGQLRLLEVDNRVVLPTNTHIRVLVTAADVIHCWAVPSLGVKVDCLPGRLNQAGLFIQREGVFYGQCSEICGVNHGFMPIVVEAVSLDKYIEWISEQQENI
jgi:cytochrome c oxidase subunit 2